MKFIKSMGRFIVYVIFFAVTWILNLLICGIIGSLYYDGSDEFTGALYSLSMLFLPVIASTLETVAFSKKWAQGHRSDCSHTTSNETAKRNEDTPYTDTPSAHNGIEPKTSPLLFASSSAITPSPHPENVNASLVNSLVNYFSEEPSLQVSPPTVTSTKTDIRDTFARYGGIDAELLTIDLMDGHDFEYWCANALRDMGFADVEVTPGSGDQGVDVLASKDGLKYAIQCKRYTSDLGNSPVQEVHAGKYIYHCHIGAVITNRYFTSGAKELAEATGVLLWDRDWIKRYLSTKASDDGSIAIQHTQQPAASSIAELDLSHDELLPAAIDVVIATGQASVSIIQRQLKLGYARAARMIDEMEEIGIVGPFQGSSPRPIYINRTEWNAVLSKIRP